MTDKKRTRVTLKNLKNHIGCKAFNKNGDLTYFVKDDSGLVTAVFPEPVGGLGWNVLERDFNGQYEGFCGWYIQTDDHLKDIFGSKPVYYIEEDEEAPKEISIGTPKPEQTIPQCQISFTLGEDQVPAFEAIAKAFNITYTVICEDSTPKFTIESEGVYKTRDGRKAYVTFVADESSDVMYPVRGAMMGCSELLSWTRTGINEISTASIFDIVAKWKD